MEADSDKLIVSKGGQPIYGRTDGVGVLPDAAGTSATTDGLVAIANGAVCKTLEPSMLCEVFEDFLGAAVVPDIDSADGSQGPWAQQNVGTSNVPVRVSDYDNGAFKLLLSNSNEVGSATLYWGDEQNIDSDQEPVLICRVMTSASGAAADKMMWGFSSAYAAAGDDTAHNCWFLLAGASLALKAESDDATTNSDDKALTTVDGTAITLTAGTWYEFKISAAAADGGSITDMRLFYRATLGGEWTRLVSGSTVFKMLADSPIQPMFHIEKTSGTTTPDLSIDYVQVYWKRN